MDNYEICVNTDDTTYICIYRRYGALAENGYSYTLQQGIARERADFFLSLLIN